MQVETVNLKINGQTVEVSFDKSSGFVVKEILVDKVYPQVPFLSGVETIVDIGANVGISCLYFHFLYPSARIHAFEPGAEALALLERNAKPFPQIDIHPFGLWIEDHVESALVPARDRLPQLSDALGKAVAVVGRIIGGGLEPFQDVRGCGKVRIADPQVDDVLPVRLELPLRLVQFNEEIGRQLLEALRRLRRSG